MKIIALIWLSCLVAVSVVLPAAAEDCVFCETEQAYPMGGSNYPLGSPQVVAPQPARDPALSRYLDAQTNATNEALSIYKYQAGILSNPQAQQQINIDRMMQDLRLQLQGR
jgi:hypothetical protein